MPLYSMKDNELFQIHHFKAVDSTNARLRDMLTKKELPEFTVVWCDKQTAGRGQMGNSWESEEGKNLTFSLLLRPDFLPVSQQFRITQLLTLALMDVLRPFSKNIAIKWPNDIYAGDKKLGGILIENSLKGNSIDQSIIGIGLNLNQIHFTSEAPNPISLSQLTGLQHSRRELLGLFLKALTIRYVDWLESGNSDKLADEYLGCLYRRDGWHRYADAQGSFEATFEGIAPDGHLLLRDSGGHTRRYAFKEVRFLP